MALSLEAFDQDNPGLPYERFQRPIFPLDPCMPDRDLAPVVFEPIGG